MDNINGFIKTFSAFWNESYLGIELGISIAVGTILAFSWLLRRKLPQLLIWAIGKAVGADHRPVLKDLLEAVRSPLEITVLVIGILSALQIAGLESLQGGPVHLILRSCVILIIFWTLVRMISPTLTHSMGAAAQTGQEAILREFAERGLRILFVLLGMAAILEQWNINVIGLLGSLGLVGAAVALGAKEFFADILGGIVLIMDKMIDRGDWIRTTDLEGTVERVGLRATRVRQFDKALVTVPNSMLVDRALINFTRMTNRRIYWKIGVEYRTSQEQLQAIIKEISDYVHGNEAFETDPNRVLTFVFLDSFGDSSINIMLYCFTKTTVWGEWLSAKQDLAYEIKKIVERNGAAFAFPSTSLYVESLPFGTPEAFPGTDSDPSSLPPQAGSDPAQ